MKADRLQWLALHALFICLVLGLAEWAAARRWLDPTFFGQPSGVAAYLWNHAGTARFWSDLGWTLAAVGCSLTFFIVLSATVAGMRGVSQDHVTLCRTLGASAATTFFEVTLPGAVPVIFSGLRLGLIYALLGVVGTEIIASEKGLGPTLAYLGSTFDINGVMALLLVLALLGVGMVRFMSWAERRLLHWQ